MHKEKRPPVLGRPMSHDDEYGCYYLSGDRSLAQECVDIRAAATFNRRNIAPHQTKPRVHYDALLVHVGGSVAGRSDRQPPAQADVARHMVSIGTGAGRQGPTRLAASFARVFSFGPGRRPRAAGKRDPSRASSKDRLAPGDAAPSARVRIEIGCGLLARSATK